MPVALIRKLETFIGLSEVEKCSLREAFHRRTAIMPGTEVICQGDPTSSVTLIIAGFGYRYKLMANGGRQIVAYVLPGDVLSSGALMGDLYDHNVRMMTPAVCSTIQSIDLMTLHPNLICALWRIVARELSITWEWVANIGQRDAKTRIAHLFCELYYRMLAVGLVEDGSFAFPVTQQEIADSVGLTNVHVNRTLQNLRTRGLITFHSKMLTILNIAALKKIAQFDPGYLHFERFDDLPRC